MELAPQCYECLQRLIRQAAEFATDDRLLREKAIGAAAAILKNEFFHSRLSLTIAANIHKAVKEVTGNPDPYRAMKEREMMLAGELYRELSWRVEAGLSVDGGERSDYHRDYLRSHLELAAAANSIDFFRELSVVREDIRKPVTFAIDHSECLLPKLREADTVLYLADNAGEIYFDLALLKRMREFAHVVYVVKPESVQDDITLDDVRESGLEGEFGEVISTGIASPGVVFALASPQFKSAFRSADLVFAKGMGHYESLSELTAEGRFFHCLKAKCEPVARSIGVPLNSYVAMLR